MSHFTTVRAIVAILIIAMFVAIPMATADIAVIGGAGRGMHTTFTGTSSSAGSLSMTAGHSASADVGFDIIQVGKGSTTQAISGGHAIANDPFAAVEVGGANVTVTAKVTGQDHTANTGVASASGHLTAEADETDNLSPEGIVVSGFIGSAVSVMTGPKGKSAEAWANASGFSMGHSEVNESSYNLTADVFTAGDTGAHAKVTEKNSAASASASISGKGNASTTSGISTSEIEALASVEGTGEASSVATGASSAGTGFVFHSGVTTNTAAEGTVSAEVTATGGEGVSEAELFGIGLADQIENSSLAVIEGLGNTEGKASAASSAEGLVEALTSSNVTGNSSVTTALATGNADSFVKTKKGNGLSAVEIFAETLFQPNLSVSAADHQSLLVLDGIGNGHSSTSGAATAVTSSNVSGTPRDTSAEAMGETGFNGFIRDAGGFEQAVSVLQGVSVINPDQDMFTLAEGTAETVIFSESGKFDGAIVAESLGEAGATGSIGNISAGSGRSSASSTGTEDMFAFTDQAGAGITEAYADISAVSGDNALLFSNLPFEGNFLVLDSGAFGDTSLNAATTAIGNGAGYDGDAEAYAAAGGASTEQLFSNTSRGEEFDIKTIIPGAVLNSYAGADGSGAASDEGSVEALVAFGVENSSVEGSLVPTSAAVQGITTGVEFDAGLVSITGVSHSSVTATDGDGATAEAYGNSSGESLVLGDFSMPSENGSTFNDAFGVTATGAFAKGKESSSDAAGMLGAFQAVDLDASLVVGVDDTETSAPLLTNGIFSATQSTAAASAHGKNANSEAETGAFDQGATVIGTLEETLPPDGSELVLDENSASVTVGTVQAEAAVSHDGESESFSGAGSFDSTGTDGSGNFTTGGGSWIGTSIDAETFVSHATATGSASVDDISAVSDGIIDVSNSSSETALLDHHSGLSDDAMSELTVSGVHDAVAFTFALALQQASVNPDDGFNGTSSSYGAFAAETEMNGPEFASAEIEGVDISGTASTSATTGAQPTLAEVFLTNGHAEANLIGTPLGGSSGAGIQTETLISAGPDPGANEIIRDGHSTTPSHSYAFGYGEVIAVSDQNAVPIALPDLKFVG